MLIPNHKRALIIGNSGCGKTWLSYQLGAKLGLPLIHLDDLRWENGQYGLIARDNQVVANDVKNAAETESWLMEGVYGWLANLVYRRASMLVWIDLPEAECIANVKQRGNQGGGSEEALQELIKWIAEYRLRNNSSCYCAHSQLFESFSGHKVMLQSRLEMSTYLENVERECT